MSFPSYSDSDLIYIFMFNCTTDIIEWYSRNSISLNITKTNNIIFSRPSFPLSIAYYVLLYLPSSQSITTLDFTINSNLDYSPHINNMILPTIFYIILENLVIRLPLP